MMGGLILVKRESSLGFVRMIKEISQGIAWKWYEPWAVIRPRSESSLLPEGEAST